MENLAPFNCYIFKQCNMKRCTILIIIKVVRQKKKKERAIMAKA